ncbi:hypothetical protein Daus18300_011184 [Diaporthe australafricana]|uniref:Uncharacterized protein n=1 Tax=Diaporthe australafricana TaxID=127596 RepID=A0ABR3W7V0_9PEZI
MPPPPLPSQASHGDSLPRILERTPAGSRTTPLSVSELIHRESSGAEATSSSASNASTHTMGQEHSLASDFMNTFMLRERVADHNIPRFLETLNHQLTLNGLLRDAREIICNTFELTERQREVFVMQCIGMLAMGKPAEEMRQVISRAAIGMSRQEMGDFHSELDRMLNGSLDKTNNPDREALLCASHVAKVPEDQQSELIRQLKSMPPAAFQSRHPHAAAKSSSTHPKGPNLPPLREWEKLADSRRAGAAGAQSQKEPIRPAPAYSLREFPIFPSH